MRFCLVSPATVTEFTREEAQSESIRRLAEHAPVGILTLAAVLETTFEAPDIVDLNVLYRDYLCSEAYDHADTDFCSFAAARILEIPFDAIGFGTICSTYPLTLRLAEAVRRARPNVPIVLGGPQASAVDLATLNRFPQIDFILRYEAEESLPALLAALRDGDRIETVRGLTYRRNAEAVRTASAPPIANLDDLPLPAYHRYPFLEQARYVPLELGRGCPYACTFCSTNDFFRRDFRLKTPKLIVAQMKQMKSKYGVPVFDLIHDMFTVDRRKVVEFCNEILESGETFTWNCSARTDRVDYALLELMAAAGCAGIFFGVETGSQRLQTILKKNLVLTDTIQKVKYASDFGFQTAVSLITGFPQENEEDFAETVDFFVRSLRFENTAPQFHILAPLADTPIEREYRDRLHFDDIISDMSHQGWEQNSADRDLISRLPDVFSNFYAVPTPLHRPFVKEVRAFLLYGARNFRWVLAALHVECGHLLTVYKDFRNWLRVNRSEHFQPGVDLTSYYRTTQFFDDFPIFVWERYGDHANGLAIAAVLRFCTAFDEVAVEDPTADLTQAWIPADGRVFRPCLSGDATPRLKPDVKILRSAVDFAELMRRIVAGERLDGLEERPSVLASRKQPGRWPEVLQLSPAALGLLELCDGRRSVTEIIRDFARTFPRGDDIPASKAAIIGLEVLRHDGLIDDLGDWQAEQQVAA